MKKRKLLIVEDNKSFSMGLKYYYQNIFDEIHIAENKTQAFNLLSKIKVDTAIIDLMLNEKSENRYEGVDIIRRIKKEKTSIKIMIVTAVDNQQIIDELKSDKEIKLFKKPVNIVELTDAIV